MGIMKFTLPAGLAPEAVETLRRAYIISGPEMLPSATQIQIQGDHLVVLRDVDESGCLVAPWEINGAGQLWLSSATLLERDSPYQLPLELARGKVNYLRNQSADWQQGGLQVSAALAQRIKDATRAFVRAVTHSPVEENRLQTENALSLACEACDELVRSYTTQVFQARQQRQPRLDTALGCRLGNSIPHEDAANSLIRSCNCVSVPISIHEVITSDGNYRWEPYDALVNWALDQGLLVLGGPLVDFTSQPAEDWFAARTAESQSLAALICDYVQQAITRYRDSIRVWQLTAGSNLPGWLGLSINEVLYLTLQMARSAWQGSQDVELSFGISQPWGEYVARGEHPDPPFLFADALARSGMSLIALDLEIVMGVQPRGSYCRDLLDLSRLLDLYAVLGLPLQVTLAYPSSAELDPQADTRLRVGTGHWRGGFDPQIQADWASDFVALALCKPYVRAVQWAEFTDAQVHLFPSCGLLDAAGKPKPVFQRLRRLREKYLR